MAVTIIPKNDVNIATQVRDVLTANGGDVSNDLNTFFKSSAKVNYLCRYKPVPLAVNFCQDFDSNANDYYPNWWKGSDGLCGLSIPTTAEMVSSQSSDGQWSWNPPKGGSSEPFRLGDFRNYATTLHTQTSLCSLSFPGTVYAHGSNKSDVNVTVYSRDEYGLSFQDMFDSLHVSCKSDNSSLIITKDISVSPGSYTASFSSSDINQLNPVAGGKIYFHFYGKKNGVLRSAKTWSGIQTWKEALVMSDEPYVPKLSVTSVSFEEGGFTVKGLKAALDATYCTGGTLEKDTGILMHEYISDNINDYVDAYALYTWTLPSLSVTQGNITTYDVASDQYLDLLLPNFKASKVAFVWRKLSSTEPIAMVICSLT